MYINTTNNCILKKRIKNKKLRESMNIALIVHVTQVSAKQSLKSDVGDVVEDIQKTTTEGKTIEIVNMNGRAAERYG